ncbi:MAG: YggT family protein [Deltaproteobacteria bacterium]|nr:YggT family protein [Deltaproteobacteria bacterium]
MIDLIQLAFRLYTFLILGRVVLSWVNHDPSNPVIRWVYRLTEPVLAPFRSIIPAMGGLDLSPILILFLLKFIENMVVELLYNLTSV